MPAEGVMRMVAVSERVGFSRDDVEGCEDCVFSLERSRLDVLCEGGATKREGAGSRWAGMLLDELGIFTIPCAI